jgi:hypothetical protein
MLNITQAHCNRCGGSTNHDIIAAEDVIDKDTKRGDKTLHNLYEILKCRGCDNVTMRNSFSFGSSKTVVYYPPAIHRRTPSWVGSELHDYLGDQYSGIPNEVRALMREIYAAVQNGARRLAGMGIRAALETVMIDKCGDQQRFKDNVAAFQQAGYLSERQTQNLCSILQAGHATIHRGWQPTDNDIVTLLDIAENVIEVVYLHEHRARDLEQKVPKRPPRQAKSAKTA